MIRLSEAHAKIRLSDAVSVQDVENAYRLFKSLRCSGKNLCLAPSLNTFSLHREALKQSAVDPNTGCVDINILAAGISLTNKKQVEQLTQLITTMLRSKKGINCSAKKVALELRSSEKLVCFGSFKFFFNFCFTI